MKGTDRELLDCPQWTRPAVFRGVAVPEVLLSGHHEEIRKWRTKAAEEKTARMRPDLLAAGHAGRRNRVNEMQNALMTKILNKNKRTDIPEFRPGDTIRVHVKIKEGDKERTQAFEGTVIARNNSGSGRDHYRAQDQLRPGRRAHLPGERAGRSITSMSFAPAWSAARSCTICVVSAVRPPA